MDAFLPKVCDEIEKSWSILKSEHEVIFWNSSSGMTHVLSSEMKIVDRQALRGRSCCMSELLTSADSSPIIVGAAED